MTTRFLATTIPALALVLGAACGDNEVCDPTVPGTICTVAGTGKALAGNDGPALEAHINTPQDMVVMPDGELWLLDFNNYVIRALDDAGNLRTVLGTGLLGDSPAPGDASIAADQALFNHTTDLFVHDGYLYLAAWHNSRIKRLDLATMRMENFAGVGKRTLYTGDEGPALEAALDLPSSIALDPAGNIAIMDQANQVIRMVDPDGIIHRIAGSCVVDLDAPCAAGQVPVACPGSNKTTCGGPESCELPCTPSYGGDGGHCLEMRMAQPFGQRAAPAGRIAYDLNGNLLFADTENNRIRRIDPDGIVVTIAGTGEAGYAGDDGPAVDAQLNFPVDVEVGSDGAIYFTDTHNSCVRVVDPSGIVRSVVGRCSTDPADRGFEGDGGDPLQAVLDRPFGIELDGDRLFVADSYNHRIRVVNF